MFDKLAKELKELGADVPKTFKRVALKGANNFVNFAKTKTDQEKLVDTGNYRRNWAAEAYEALPDVYAIECINPVEYSMHLELGHKIKGTNKKVKGRYVGRWAFDETEFYCLEQLDIAIEKALRKL